MMYPWFEELWKEIQVAFSTFANRFPVLTFLLLMTVIIGSIRLLFV